MDNGPSVTIRSRGWEPPSKLATFPRHVSGGGVKPNDQGYLVLILKYEKSRQIRKGTIASSGYDFFCSYGKACLDQRQIWLNSFESPYMGDDGRTSVFTAWFSIKRGVATRSIHPQLCSWILGAPGTNKITTIFGRKLISSRYFSVSPQ